MIGCRFVVVLLVTSLLGVLPASSGAASSVIPPAQEADERRPVLVVNETFDRRSAARAFRTSGPGTWKVAGGRYRLGPQPGRSLSVLRRTIQRREWRLDTQVRLRRGGRGNLSVVFGYRSRRDYSFVHLAQRRGASAVVRVRRGVPRRVADLDVRIARGRAYAVRLRRDGPRLRVRVGRVGARARPVGSARIGRRLVLRPGYGSTGGAARFDNLRVRVSGAAADPPRGGRAVDVRNSDQLTAALADARPGDVISMADGVYTDKGQRSPIPIGDQHYTGTFLASVSGTADRPIVLQGSAGAVIDGKPADDGTGTQYGLYLVEADHWTISGITVRNVSKGIVLDRSNHGTIAGVTVHTTGQEGIHLRAFSSDNVVRDNVVRDTGRRSEQYGEGIYVGSANSNWGTYTDGRPDASNRNRLLRNRISSTGAESMDIKEGTTGGVIRGNVFDGTGMAGGFADSWVDVKGNRWRIEGNTGTDALEDGFQVHGALAGWGHDNVFSGNTADVNGPGYGFWVQNNVTGTVIECGTNVVRGAASGFDNLGRCGS